MIPTTEKSSSSEGPNSSSETELCKSLPVDEIPYNAKSACLKNNGHCYKCKAGISESDCLSSWAWQNPYTPVNTYHWFNEVDCSTGEKTDKGIGVCPAQPLDAIPSDLSNACFAMDGKCYKCKDSSPYGGCAQSWIWTQKLYYAEPYYLEEVDCYDPFEEDISLKCYEVILNSDENDELFLLKQQLNKNDFYKEKPTINSKINKIYSYDVIGRTISKNKMKKSRPYFIDYKIIEYEQSFVTHVLKKDQTCNGYVKGIPVIKWCETKIGKDGEYKVANIKISMNIISGPIHTECNDTNLIAHEKKHKEIWDDKKYNIEKTTALAVPKNKSKKDICLLEAEKSWAYVRDNLYDLYTRHNSWDSLDTNNTSHARFNIPQLMKKHKNTFLNKCK